MFDVTIVTEKKYLHAVSASKKEQTILLEDQLLKNALEHLGCKVNRSSWDSDFDWGSTKIAILRSVFDYFYRIEEFINWLETAKEKTQLLNSFELVKWNFDKHYLQDLSANDIPICFTEFVSKGDKRSLQEIIDTYKWSKIVLKPAISATAEDTFAIPSKEINNYESIFQKLVKSKSMLIQPFQFSIPEIGEKSIMILGGDYSHAVNKMAAKGDFRVQSDFGGTVHLCEASSKEIELAERTVDVCETVPDFARVDLVLDNAGVICVSELELIEPELWFRLKEEAAPQLAQWIVKYLS